MPRKSAAPVSGKEETALLLEKLTYPDDFPLNISVVNMKEDPLHYHIDTELVYVLRGEIRLKNGYCSYDLQEGDVFTNSGHEVHSISALSEDNVVALIQVNTHYMSQYFPNLSKACYRTYSRKRADKKHDRLRELLLQILLKYEARSVNYKSECIYLAVELIKHLDKYFNLFIFDKNVVVGFDRGNQLAMERISRICQYIYQFYASNITLEDLSQMEHLSSFYISHLIKDFTGMNFRDFLCFARVEWSEIDLLGTEKKISQIANDVLKGVLNHLTPKDVDFLLDAKILTIKEIASGGVPQYKIKERLDKLNLIKKPKIIPGLARALAHLTQIDAVCAKMPEAYDPKAVAAWRKAYEAL